MLTDQGIGIVEIGLFVLELMQIELLAFIVPSPLGATKNRNLKEELGKLERFN